MTGPWQILRALLEAEKRFHGYEPGQAPRERQKTAAEYKNELVKLITRRFGEHEADEVMADMRRLGGFKAFRDHIATKYMSDEINKIVTNMGKAAADAAAKRAGPAKKDEPDVPGAARGSSGKQYVDPELKGQKQASIDQMRAMRAGAGAGGTQAAQALMSPSKGGGHAVGSAGAGQPKLQPSQATQIVPQRDVDPTTGARLMPRSGIVAAQRKVDRLTKEKGAKEGDRLAATLGVPTTAERTKRDPDTGEESVQIWGPDRVAKFMDVDTKPVPGAMLGRAAKSMAGAELPKQSPDELRRQAAAKRAALAAKGESDPERIEKIKQGILKRQRAGGKVGPDRPGSHHGEVWAPHGQSGEKMISRPDPATGNWQRGKIEVGPKPEEKARWDEYEREWVLPSVWVSREAERKASSTAEPYSRVKTPQGKAGLPTSKGAIPMWKRHGENPPEPPRWDPSKKRMIDPDRDDDDDEYPPDQGWRKVD